MSDSDFDSDDYSESSISPAPLNITGKLFMRDVYHALESIEFVGDFATFDQYASHRIRSIKVKDVGDVLLPLQEAQARQMIEKARLAPFGKGTETIVDTSVRNTWELSPDQFELGSEFNDQLDLIRAKVRVDLGIRTNIRAELYKMLIYEKGAMFKPHKDTEKTPGMFGTLVICLDSPHKGGKVRLRHQGIEKTYDTSSACNSFAAWYGDVTHEVLPVESGYRWVLTYNLAIDSVPELPSAALQANHSNITRVENLLQSWLTLPKATRAPAHFYYALEHKYTEASISLKNLKQADLIRAQALMKLSWTLPVKILLAVVEKQVTHALNEDFEDPYAHVFSECESEDSGDLEDSEDSEYELSLAERVTADSRGEELERYCTVISMVDVDGNVVLQDFGFSEKNFLNRDCFDPDNPDDEESEFTGNEGGSRTTHYDVTAICVVPTDSFPDFLHKSNGGKVSSVMVSYWSKESEKSESGSDAHKMLVKCWKSKIDYPTSTQTLQRPNAMYSKCIQDTLFTALRLRDFALFEKAASAHKGHLNTDCLRLLRNSMEEQCLDGPDGSQSLDLFVQMKQGLSQAVLAYSNVATTCRALSTFVNSSVHSTSTASQAIQAWKSAMLRRIASQWYRLAGNGRTADTMLHLIDALDEPVQWIANEVLPSLGDDVHLISFWQHLFVGLSQRATAPPYEHDTYRHLYKVMLKAFLEHVDIHSLLYDGPDVAWAPESGMTHKDFISFVTTVGRMSQNGDGTVELLWDKIFSFELWGASTSQVTETWVPFICGLTKALPRTAPVLRDPRYQKLHADILTACLTRYVRAKPQQRTTYAQPPVECSCDDCRLVNVFLTAPERREEAFAVPEDRRRHMQMELKRANADCECSVVKQGRPHHLKVIKRVTLLKAEIEAWTKHLSAARRVLTRLKPYKSILGPVLEEQEHLLDLLSRSPLSERSDAANTPSMTTEKRERENTEGSEASKRIKQGESVVVDLTGE